MIEGIHFGEYLLFIIKKLSVDVIIFEMKSVILYRGIYKWDRRNSFWTKNNDRLRLPKKEICRH